jgi:hypothetical protein
MNYILIPLGIGLCYFLVFGLDDVVESIMKGKAKIAEENRKAAEANRDAEKYRLEAAHTGQ